MLRLRGGGKKRKKKVYTKPKKVKHVHKKVKLAFLKLYKVDDAGKVTRLRKECPAPSAARVSSWPTTSTATTAASAASPTSTRSKYLTDGRSTLVMLSITQERDCQRGQGIESALDDLWTLSVFNSFQPTANLTMARLLSLS